MTKREYLDELRARLSALPADEVERAVSFYEEAIDDRVEAGLSEEEAVAEMESPAAAAERILSELPSVPRALAQARSKSVPTSWFVLGIVLLVLGSPLWAALLVAVLALIASGFVALLSCLVGIWAVVLSFLLGAVFGGLGLFLAVGADSLPVGLVNLGIGLAMSGIGLLGLQLAVICSHALLRAIARFGRWVVSPFVRVDEPASAPQPAQTIAGMGPVWRTVNIAAAALLAAGVVSGTVGFGLTGFSTARFAQASAQTSERISDQLSGTWAEIETSDEVQVVEVDD